MLNYLTHLNSHLSPFFLTPNPTKLQTLRDGSHTLTHSINLNNLWNYEEITTVLRNKTTTTKYHFTIEAIRAGDWDIFLHHINTLYTLKDNSLDQYNLKKDGIMKWVVKYGRIEMIKWFRKRGKMIVTQSSMDDLIKRGDLAGIKWVWSRYPYLSARSFNSGIVSRNKEMVDWLISKGCPYNRETIATAAKYNDFRVIKWLDQNHCPRDKRVFKYVAEYGSLEMMKWLFERNYPWDERTFSRASGRLSIKKIKWLDSKGCPRDERVFNNMVEYGNLKVLDWLYRKGYPSGEGVFIRAVGDLKVMDWLYEKGYLLDERVFNKAVERGDFKLVKWLYKKKCPWNKMVFMEAVRHGNLKIAKWLYEHGCPVCENVLRILEDAGWVL